MKYYRRALLSGSPLEAAPEKTLGMGGIILYLGRGGGEISGDWGKLVISGDRADYYDQLFHHSR